MEKKDNSEKLKVLIKSLVQEELKKSSKEIARLIKEQVETQVRVQVKAQVNEILAEQFLKNISGAAKGGLTEVFDEEIQKPQPKVAAKPSKQISRLRESANEAKLQELRSTFGTGMDDIFKDLDMSGPRIMGGGSKSLPGAYVDPDDDLGVDLSKIGF